MTINNTIFESCKKKKQSSVLKHIECLGKVSRKDFIKRIKVRPAR